MSVLSRDRLLPCTAALATVFALLTLVFILAPYCDWALRGRQYVVAASWGVVRFPAFLLDRDRHCTLPEAWSIPVHVRLSWVKTVQAMRLTNSDKGLDQVDTPAGRFWIPKGDQGALAEEFDEENANEYGDGVRGVHAGDVVLDCGASVGVFTRKALASGASRVVAIEPAPWALECLRRNLAPEIAQGRVVVYPKGVWDRDDNLELSVGPDVSTTAGTLVLAQGKVGMAVVVPLTTIDRLTSELNLPRVDFIKMDIEGAEPNALRGAARTVARFHPRLAISLEHRATDPDTIPALTRELWPDYHVECGPCTNNNGHLQPTVMFAQPDTTSR